MKKLVAVAEEESRGGAIQLFLSPFLPSFTANHSCFTRRCKAVVGAYTSVVVHWTGEVLGSLWSRGKLPWRIFPLVYIQNALN